jgi:hypothetical protein
MKKIILVCFATVVTAASMFAAPTSFVSEKVLKVFHAAFPEVKQPIWYSYENYYEVFFANADNSSCRIDYAPDGTVLNTTRYYKEANLSPVVRAAVNEKYPGKKIFGITEVSNNENITYYIVLEDSKHWYNVQSNATGNISLDKKLLKAE